MSIIEREIERRETLIVDNNAKAERAEALKAEAAKLEAEVASFDETTLRDEIKELETYLPVAEPETVEIDEPVIDTTFGTPFSY